MRKTLALVFLLIPSCLFSQELAVRQPSAHWAGTSLPVVCLPGDAYTKTDAASGQRAYLCVSPDTWEQQTGAAGGAHAADHQENGSDELLGETQGTACTENQILKANATGGLDCGADNDSGGSPTFDQVGAGTNTTAAMVVGSGASLRSAAGIFGVPNSTTLPANCTVGDLYFDNDASIGLRFNLCTATDTWTAFDNPFGTTIGAAELETDSVSADELNATGVEAELEAVLDLQELQGAVTDGQVPDTITVDLATLATTATTANAGDSATAFFSTGILESAIGGTGNGFTLFSGTATTEKTFTLPNATSTILTTNAAGTVGQGGSGAATLTGLLQGNGTSAFTAITDSITAGQTLRVTGASTYAWGALDLADTDAITGDIPDGNLSANVSLLGQTISGGEMVNETVTSTQLAAGNKTINRAINIFDPTTGDTNKVQIYWPAAVTLTRVVCSVDTGTVTIQFDERAEATPNTAGTDSLTSALVCDTDSQVTTSFSDAGIAVDVPHNLQITGASGTPTIVRIHVKATIN